MSQDFTSLYPCTHVNGKYLINNCPICLSVGYYFDIVLGQDGDMKSSNGVNKVVQEVVHLFATSEGVYTDYGYSEYGSKLNRFIGSKNMVESRLKFQVLRDLQYLDYIKGKQDQQFRNIDRSEVIEKIVAIKNENSVDSQTMELSCIIGDSDTIQNFTIRQFNL